MLADVIVDLQHGDTGKGKVAHAMSRSGEYTHVLRYNGGPNAGHTIIHDGQQYITHHVPVGVFSGVPSIIGPGCVVHPGALLEELKDLEARGVSVSNKVHIARNAHIITDAHIAEDRRDSVIGTTRRGVGPAYRDKYARSGIRAEDVRELQPFLVDVYDLFHGGNDVRILCEGAQGFWLDIDWGEYPYVTSSHCTVAGALLNGIPPKAVRHVWGVAKIYETYVGHKSFQPDDDVFQNIREFGEEYGATTGRARQCNWLDWERIERAIRINGVTHVVFNKIDILQKVGLWKLYERGSIRPFLSEEAMRTFLLEKLAALGIPAERVFFSSRKDAI